MTPMDDAALVMIAKALADPTRYRILNDIRAAGELTCSEVCERQTAKRQPTISHHIGLLEDAGLITIRREGCYHVLTVNENLLAAFARAVSTGVPTTKAKAVRGGTRSSSAPKRGRGGAATGASRGKRTGSNSAR
jgi:ArsR family transcriptional regulator, arsenate/arsenite/antimonite-responsive transcriptional repressor